MKISKIQRNAIEVVLSGEYTPYDLREFVQLCYVLARPLIRKKIHVGKINLNAIGLSEGDIIYDCLADIFQRDDHGNFPQLKTFFGNHCNNYEHSSDEEVLIVLSYLVIGQINNHISRLYQEVDPTLAKILRNLKLALDRTNTFDQTVRFNDVYLIPRDIDILYHLPPLPADLLKQELSRIVLVHDNIPEMVRKLHTILVGQQEYQRTVPLIESAILFKEVYRLGWDAEQDSTEVIEEASQMKDIRRLCEKVCLSLYQEFYRTYVEGGKCSSKLYEQYRDSLIEVLYNDFGGDSTGRTSYFECLKEHLPDLTREEYATHHRSILEYLGKIAKTRMKEMLKDE